MEKKEIKREVTYFDLIREKSELPTGWKKPYLNNKPMGVNEIHERTLLNHIEYIQFKDTKLNQGLYYTLIWKS